ncbi:MAG: transposase family protein, partial [bacterium]|nr:transposase family protein [bacterium]
MRMKSLWRRLLDVEGAIIKRVEFDESEGAVVAVVRPPRKARNRCGRCGRRCGRYDAGEGRRRWRGLDLGTVPVYLAAEAPRV